LGKGGSEVTAPSVEFGQKLCLHQVNDLSNPKGLLVNKVFGAGDPAISEVQKS